MVVMRTSRGAAVAAVASVGLILAGCGGGGDAAPTSEAPKPSPLASWDPCKAFSPQELQAIGVKAEGRPVDQGIGETGCKFMFGEKPFILALYKGKQQSGGYWDGQRGNFGVFEPNQVGASQGIRMVTKSSMKQGICNQAILVGGGSVSVQVAYRSDKIAGADPCSDALKIAQQIEPKLPK